MWGGSSICTYYIVSFDCVNIMVGEVLNLYNNTWTYIIMLGL